MKVHVHSVIGRMVGSALLAAAMFCVSFYSGRVNAGSDDFSRAVSLLTQGEQSFDFKALSDAERILLKECQGPDRDSTCEYHLARVYLAMYSYYSQVHPDNLKALDALTKAEVSGLAAIVRRPNDALVHVLMGRVYQVKLSRFTFTGLTRAMLFESPVVREFERALELDPDNGEAELGLGIYYQFIPRVMGGDGHRARTHFKRAVKLLPKNPEPLVWISISYREEGRLDEARNFIDRAVALDAENKFVQAEAARLRAAEKQQGAG